MIGGWKLFLDDERFPPDGAYPYEGGEWIIARSYDDAVWCVENYGMPSVISFDHDLGMPGDDDPFTERVGMFSASERSGYDFAKWLCGHAMDRGIRLSGSLDFVVHSQNPVGAANITGYIRRFMEAEDGR